MNHIVLGIGYGDEGKGSATAYFTSRCDPRRIVIRFSGGHQAGHTVVDNKGRRHVFSHFGSGTLDDTPTFWSKYCTFYPTGLWNEYATLKKLDKTINPFIFIDPQCPVTTFYDLFYNRALELSRDNRHGSVGVGVGQTIERNGTPYKLFAQDILFDDVLEFKLKAISDYYSNKFYGYNNADTWAYYLQNDFNKAKKVFLEAVNNVREIVNVCGENVLSTYDNLIFEGSQGILLDQDHGFFPHVSRGYTTSKNAIELLKRIDKSHDTTYIHYVTRSYSTRHGIGPMTGENEIEHLKEIEDKTNIPNDWQGSLRLGCLDIDMMKYAIMCDDSYSNPYNKSLVFTCMDQLKDKEKIVVRESGKLKTMTAIEIAIELDITEDNCYFSESPKYDRINK